VITSSRRHCIKWKRYS